MAYSEQSRRPNVVTLKTVLDRSKESKSVSPYKEKEVEAIKVQPEPVSPIEDVLASEPPLAPNPIEMADGGPKTKAQPEKSMNPNLGIKTPKYDFTTGVYKPYASDKPFYTSEAMDAITNLAIDITADQKYSGKYRPSKSKEDYKKDLLIGYKNGDYVLSPNGGLVTKPAGVFQSGADSFMEFFDNKSNAINYFTKGEDEQSSILEKEFVKSLLAVPKGETSTVGTVAGGIAGGITAMTAATAASSLALGSTVYSGGATTPAVLAAVSATLNGGYMAFGTGYETEKETYIRARNNGMSQKQAIAVAKRGRDTNLTTSFAENAALTLAGNSINASLTAAQKAAGNSLSKYLTKTALYNVPEALGSSGFGSLMEYARAKQMESSTGDKDINPSERAMEAFKYGMLLNGSIKTLSTTVGAAKIAAGNALKARALNMAATADKNFIKGRLAEMKQSGEITQDIHDEILKQVDDFAKLKKENPQITEDKAPTVIGLMLKKKKLQTTFNKMDAKNPLKASTLADIDDINTRIKKALSSDDELAGENDPITGAKLTSEDDKIQEYTELISRRKEQYAIFEKANKDNPEFAFADGFEAFSKKIDEEPNYLSDLYNKAKEMKVKGLSEDIDGTINSLKNKDYNNATTNTEGQVQEGNADIRVGEYKGAEGEQAQATNEADNSNRPIGSQTQEVKIPKSFDTPEGKRVLGEMEGQVEKVVKRELKNFDTTKKATRARTETAILEYLKGTKLYEDADDVAREALYRDAMKHFFNKRFKPAPTADAILGQVNFDKSIKEPFSTNEKYAFKRLFKTAEKTMKWAKQTEQDITKGVSNLVSRGVLSGASAKAILSKFSKLDLSNQQSINNFVDYTSNVFNKSNYINDLQEANALRTKINGLSKSKTMEITLSKAAKEFGKIKPEQVDDIQGYIAKAKELFDGVKRPRRIEKGTRVEFQQPFQLDDVYDFVSKHKEGMQEKMKANMLEDFSDLVDDGVISKDMSFDEMNTIVSAIEKQDPTAPVQTPQDKINSIRAFLDRRFSNLSGITKSLLDKGIDGFGNKVELDIPEEDRTLLNSIMKAGIKNMKINDAYRVIEGLGNFVTNGEHSGLQKPLYSYYGDMQAEFNRQNPIKAITKQGKSATAYANAFGSLPLYMSKMFGVKDVEFGKMSGINDFKNSTSQALTRLSSFEDGFKKIFNKFKPNGLVLNSQDNIHEMGLYSHMVRNAGGTVDDIADEFRVRKSLLDDSINKMISSDDKDISKLGSSYKKTFDKLLKDANSIEEVKAKMDKTNVDAVHYWIDKWNDLYPEMQSHAKNFYNKDLGRQNNFTPDVFKSMIAEAKKIDEDMFEEGFIPSTADMIFKKESGRFMPSNIQEKAPENKYISLDFLSDTKNTMKSTLIDLNTSKYVAQMDAFIKSKGLANSFDNQLNAANMEKRFKKYVNSVRGKSSYNSDIVDGTSFTKTASTLAAISASATLASVRGAAQQLSPLSKSFMQTGRLGIKEVLFDENINRLMNTSGRDIANSSIEGQLNFNISDRFMKSSTADANTVSGFFKDAAAFYGQKFIGNADALARRAAFWAHYTKYLEDNGTDVSKVNWSKVEKLDDFAADYAQAQVDKTQNVIQTELKGSLMSSKDPNVGFVKNLVMPLSDFMMNQKLSFFNNVGKATRWSSSVEDRIDGAKNAFGTVLETTVFNSIRGSIGSLYQIGSDALNDYTPSEIEKERRAQKRTEASTRNTVTDLVSPIPMANFLTEWGVGKVIDLYYENFTDVPEQLRPNLGKSSLKTPGQELGLIGISASGVVKGIDMFENAYSGEVEKEIQGQEKKYKIIEGDKARAAVYGSTMVLQSLGLFPADLKQVANEGFNNIKKKALTESEMKSYNKLLNEAAPLVRDKFKNVDGKTIFDEIPYILTKNDPLAKAEYLIELKNKYGQESIDGFNFIMDKYNTNREVKNQINIINKKDMFAMMAMEFKDQDGMDIAKAISYQDQDVVVYNLFKKREDMKANPTTFYKWVKSALGGGAISQDLLAKYAVYAQEKMPDFSYDKEMLIDMSREVEGIRKPLR